MTNSKRKHRVLVVGQTPPPFGGQAMMIEKMLQCEFNQLEMFHVRMSFSREMDDIGKFQLSKIWHLLSIIYKVIAGRVIHRTKVLYYPPAGPDKIPMFRDFVILVCCRWMFRKTVFHFHAGGISELYPSLSKLSRFLFRKAYYDPDGAILLSELNPEDGTALRAKQQFVIPYGIDDIHGTVTANPGHSKPIILFVAVLKESKGVLVLLDALAGLLAQGVDFEARIMGKFESPQFEDQARSQLSNLNLTAHVTFIGVLSGSEKWQQFADADIFCYPSFFESETFGLVVLEAMQFQLPVVVTNWRGIPSLVKEAQNGFVIPIKNHQILTERLLKLCRDPALAKKMGKAGRQRYLQHYSAGVFRERIETALIQVAEQGDG